MMNKSKSELKIKIDKGEELDELRESIIQLINNTNLNFYEVLGVLDVIRMDLYLTCLGDDEGEEDD